jgi:site-specific recombinase XerD
VPTPPRFTSGKKRTPLPMTSNGATSENSKILTDYMRHKRHEWCSPETVRVRKSQLGQISGAIPDLGTVSEEDVLRWHDGLTGSAENIAQYTSVITGLFAWMVSVQRLRVDNPAAILRRPRVPVRQPRPMLERHYELALACALADPEMYLWLGLMGCSGFRCCEVAWCRTYEFEAQDNGGAIARVVGKGNKRRSIPIGAMLYLTLKPFLLGGGYVFTRENGQSYTPQRVSERTNNFLRNVGISETAHTLRHRFGTDYHSLDPDLYRQAKIMGHSSVTTTQLYTDIDPVEAAKYIETLTQRRLRNLES